MAKRIGKSGYNYDGGSKKEWINGAIYGDYGIGKTYFVGTMYRDIVSVPMTEFESWEIPEGVTLERTMLLANAEKGDKGLPADCEGIIVQDIYDYDDFSRMYDFLKLHCKLRLAKDIKKLLMLQQKYFGLTDEDNNVLFIFDGVGIDSLTEIQKYCLYQLIGLSQDSKLSEEPDYMQQRQWGTALEMILLMVRNFRALPMHKMFVIQQMEDTDEKKKLFFRPALQGQAKLSILGFFDFVGYYRMAVKEDVILRRMFLLPSGPFKAKHRFEKFTGKWLDNPTFTMILDLQ